MKKLVLAVILFSLWTGCTQQIESNLKKDQTNLTENSQKRNQILINYSDGADHIYNFWNSTGLTPAVHFLRKDMQQTLGYLGSINNNGMKYIRPHYLLNLISCKGFESGQPEYSWSKLDSAIDILVKNDLKLIFEIMGTPPQDKHSLENLYDEAYQQQIRKPESYFDDFNDPKQLKAWKQLIEDMAIHLEKRYGKNEVRSWYFETWNEPDGDFGWEWDNHQEFLNYYDACSEGLKAADPQLKFGGPGTAGGNTPLFRALLEHCDDGRNYFTGEKGVRIDFISVHRKFSPHPMVNLEKNIIEYIRNNHPSFSNKPFFNDEADPLAGWSEEYWWRPRAWYASFFAQSVDLHYKELILEQNSNYQILSNDNGFLGNWYHRTQLARFQSENNPNHFYLVKKPVLTVASLLSRLQSRYYAANRSQIQKNTGVMATKHPHEQYYATLVYNCPSIQQKVESLAGQKFIERLSPQLKTAHQKTEKGYITEVRIPLAEFSIPGKVGSTFGLDLGYNDSDTDRSRDHKVMAFDSTDQAYNDPLVFGKAILDKNNRALAKDSVVYIPRIEKAIKIDGNPENIWSKSFTKELNKKVIHPVDNSDDLAANFRALWDDNYLYLLIEIQDDTLKRDADIFYNEDGLEIYLDGDFSHSDRYDANDFQLILPRETTHFNVQNHGIKDQFQTHIKPQSEKKNIKKQGAKLRLILQNLDMEEARLIHYRINNEHNNPYQIWQEMGKPSIPTHDQIQKIREHQNPAIAEIRDVSIEDNTFIKNIEMPGSEVNLLILAQKPARKPAKIRGIEFQAYTGLNGEREIMLTWNKTSNPYIKGYEIYFKPKGKNSYKIINKKSMTFDSHYIHSSGKKDIKGSYKIRAVDYWGRKGAFSDLIELH